MNLESFELLTQYLVSHVLQAKYQTKLSKIPNQIITQQSGDEGTKKSDKWFIMHAKDQGTNLKL